VTIFDGRFTSFRTGVRRLVVVVVVDVVVARAVDGTLGREDGGEKSDGEGSREYHRPPPGVYRTSRPSHAKPLGSAAVVRRGGADGWNTAAISLSNSSS